MNEFKLIQSLEHPHIIKCFGVTNMEGMVYIVMERGKGDLKTYIKEERAPFCKPTGDLSTMDHMGAFKNKYLERLRILVGIVEAIRYMHSRDVLHLDIKPHNVILTEGNQPKLCDFGLSQFMGTDATVEAKGFTVHYSAPEALSGKRMVTKAADVYGIGVMIYTLLTLLDPHHLFKRKETANGMYSELRLRKRRMIWSQFFQKGPATYWIQQLVHDCTNFDPWMRPTIDEVQDRLHSQIKSLIVSEFSGRG
jgi:serine/threonine protein kinase